MKGTPKYHQNTVDFQTDVETPSGKLAVHHFRVPGYSKKFCLRKRAHGRFEPWYLVGTIKGRRFHRSLQSHEIKVAEATAREKYILPAMREDWQTVAAGSLKRQFATLGELRAAWVSLALGAGAAHKAQAANQFGQVLRLAGADDKDGASCGQLTEKLAMDYFSAVAREADEKEEQVDAARRKRTGIRTWAQAVCLVQPLARVAYRHAGLVLPEVTEMLDCGRMLTTKLKSGAEYVPKLPDFALMQRLLEEWPRRPWNEFAAVAMALAFGLRAGEWGKACWNWFKCEEGRWRLEATTAVKNKTGGIEVRALDPFWSVFWKRAVVESCGQAESGEGAVLTGSEAHRTREVEREVSAWMRSAGWTEQKTNHAFRAYAGALVVLRWDHATAQSWLRHASVETTQKHYTAGWIKANRDRKAAVEWAK